MRLVRSVAGGLVTLLILATALGVIVFWQEISDYLKVQSYQPTSSIIKLADRSGMSDKGRFYFYVTSPQLETAAEFNDECRRAEQGSPILGCYNSGTDTIHIFDIDNTELDGIKEVTAAHEMLHAVFARLSESEINQLKPKLESVYQSVKTDKLEERMGYYERTAPGSRINELHSIIGTEFSDIGQELEDYYSRYFINRMAVVNLHLNYSQKFDAIEREIEDLSKRLSDQEKIINQMSRNYERDVEMMNAKIDSFNQRAENGYFTSHAQFEQAKASLTQEINQLDAMRENVMKMVDDYNQDVARLNDLGGRMNELNKSLDSLQGIK